MIGHIISVVMIMDEQLFSKRLSELRAVKNVSAREMSLALGQNPSYINRIENGLALPSMQCFFYICEYLGVTPSEFFDVQNPDPHARRRVEEALRLLDAKQLDLVLALIEGLLDARRQTKND